MFGKHNDLVNVSRLQKLMDDQKLDALVATTMGNVYYFTGFLGEGLRGFPYDSQTYAVVTRDNPLKPYFITTQGLSNQALDAFDLEGVAVFGSFFRAGPFNGYKLTEEEQYLVDVSIKGEVYSSPVDALVAVLGKMGLADKKVGIDEINFAAGNMEALAEKLPKANFVQATETLRQIRKVKTDAEIRRLRKVSHMNELAIQSLLGIVSAGVTEIDLAREYSRSVSSQGGVPNFTCLRVGPNGVMAEREPTRAQIKPGEPIFIDVGCEFHGYFADFGRTACLGTPSARLSEVYEPLKISHLKAIEMAKPGMTGGELFDLTVEEGRKAGLTHYERHHTGHGIGLELYENVLISPGNDDVIEEGTVINHESPYYEFGLGGLIVEDPFVVRASGNEVLTTLSPELLVVAE